jgi:sirohydrochlorin cobaltochelatase
MAQSMSSAPFVWHPDGRPDWASMWTTFCELALFGGPPQRGPESALRAPAFDGASDAAMLAEMRRGIWETTGLYAEASAPGRLAVSCDSPAMAQWMATAIALENVEAHADEDRIILPSGPAYRLEDEVKSIITVVAKTHHYWQAHVMGAGDP